jgi:hypothetical protein
MVLGVSIIHVLVLMVLLISIALPFVLVTHTRHARAQITIILLLTLVWLVLFLLFGSHASDRSDLVMLRSYAFSSALCTLADELLSARDESAPTRFIVLLLFGMLFLLTLVALIGGVSGKF